MTWNFSHTCQPHYCGTINAIFFFFISYNLKWHVRVWATMALYTFASSQSGIGTSKLGTRTHVIIWLVYVYLPRLVRLAVLTYSESLRQCSWISFVWLKIDTNKKATKKKKKSVFPTSNFSEYVYYNEHLCSSMSVIHRVPYTSTKRISLSLYRLWRLFLFCCSRCSKQYNWWKRKKLIQTRK